MKALLLWEVSRWAPAKSVGRGARRTRGNSEPRMCVAFNMSLLGVRKGRKKKARQVDLRRPRVVTMYIAQNPKWKSCFHSKSISCNGVKKVGASIMFNTNIHTERAQILSVQLKGSYTNSLPAKLASRSWSRARPAAAAHDTFPSTPLPRLIPIQTANTMD